MDERTWNDARAFLQLMEHVYARSEHQFLCDMVRVKHQSPAVTLAEMDVLWEAAQMPREPDLVWQALVQIATLAWRAARALEAREKPC